MVGSLRSSLVASLLSGSAGHATLTYPPARTAGDYSKAGIYEAYVANHTSGKAAANGGFWWFSQPMVIPGEPTLTDPEDRTFNVHVSGGKKDWSRQFPWRAPGTAPVRGSGCGVAGGSSVQIPNGGTTSDAKLYPFGMDGAELPATESTKWTIGGTAEVAFAILANHGGGYSYRLCKKSDGISEECFQKNVLRFHGNESRIRYSDTKALPDVPLPRRIVPTDKTHPKGSQWARNPIPSCFYCDQSKCGGVLPDMTQHVTNVTAPCDPSMGCFGGNTWWKQEVCAQQCSGSFHMRCGPGKTQFAEPAPGLSGYLGDGSSSEGFSYSLVDEVKVPADLKAGEYLLSWRWDAEQSPQIWQNCADISLVQAELLV